MSEKNYIMGKACSQWEKDRQEYPKELKNISFSLYTKNKATAKQKSIYIDWCHNAHIQNFIEWSFDEKNNMMIAEVPEYLTYRQEDLDYFIKDNRAVLLVK